jgi:hypothetical protein
MKKTIQGILGILLTTPLYALEDYTAQSFMFTRPAQHNIAMMQAQWHDYTLKKHGSCLAAIQAIPFYQKTLEHREHNPTASYFLLNCKENIIIRGDTVGGNRDVRAEWLNLPSNFSGIMSINPQQQQYGVILDYHQDIKKILNHRFFHSFWLNVSMSILTVKNNIHVQQSDLINPGTEPSNIIEAFNQPTWHFAKINEQELKKTGIGEIKFKLGILFYANNHFEVTLYELISLPASKTQNPTFVFSPFLGNNRHFAVGTGATFQFPTTRDQATFPFLFFVNIEHQFLIRNQQHRTFDLFDKPWSRYLLLNKADGTQTNVPAVNVLTRTLKVKPDSFVDFATGFRAMFNGFEGELGYDLWAHGRERTQFKKTICPECRDEIKLTDYGIAGSGPGKSASKSTINSQAFDDPNFITLSETDLNLDSGLARSTITHRAHGALGYGRKGRIVDGFGNIGAFYEHPQNNAALQQWGIWAKIGIAF